MRIHFETLGCRLNEAETETWRREFLAHGDDDAPRPEDADVIVVNSCAVTEEAVRKSRKLARRARRANPTAKLVLSGCYATLDSDRAAAELGVDLLVANPDKPRLPALVRESLALPAMPAARIDSVAPALPAGRQRAFIKVQDGCRYQCTFCIVTQARGAERSRPIAEVVEEIQALRASGVREVVLSGVHLGGYGSNRGDDLSVLLRAILDDTDIPRVRLGSLEPWDIPDDFWALFDDARLMPHLHLPLQSGCDRTLRRMARRCKSTAFAELVARAREHVPAINITTDIIVGFPGESDTDWRESMETIARIGFGHVHIFTYSPRAGTRAATLPEQVARETKRLRSEQLHALAQRMKHATLRAHLGQRAQVLVEASPLRDGEQKYPFSGYTPNFLRVALDGLQQNDVNRIIEVELAAAEHRDDCLIARPVASQPTAGNYRSKSAQIGA